MFESSKLKARTSLFTETWQKRRSSFELWAFEHVIPSGIGCTSCANSSVKSELSHTWCTTSPSYLTHDVWGRFNIHAVDSRYMCTGLNVLAKNRRNWNSISSIQASKSQNRDFRHFSGGKSALFKWKCQIREFHAHGMEQGEVLKRYCGWQKEAKLLKQKSKDRTFIHAAGALQ